MNRSKTKYETNNRDQRKKQNSSRQKKNGKKYESNEGETVELLTDDESDSSSEIDKLGGKEENHVKLKSSVILK
jgi:hypothetical protein